jgi:AraC-like DNA-binding protein
VAKRKYVDGPSVSPARRFPVESASIQEALGSIPEVVTFEAITVGNPFRDNFHSTASHEMIHVLQGRARIKYQRRSFVVGPKDTFVIPRGKQHCDGRFDDEAFRAFYLFFHWDTGDDLVGELCGSRLLNIPQASKDLLHHLMIELEREYQSRAGASPERLNLMVLEILLAMFRYSQRPGRRLAGAGRQVAKQKREQLALQARGYIEEHYAEVIGLEEMARLFDVSQYHLSRAFSGHFGMSLSDALTMKRMDSAKELLKTSALSVKEIAAQTGYSGGSYFAKVFSRACGLSPSEYRLKASKRKRK